MQQQEDPTARQREAWAAERLARAGVTAETHMVKFDGTVMPREAPAVIKAAILDG